VRPRPRHVIFDFGGVLIDWNPRHLYRDLIGDEDVMEDFLARVCTQAWNREQDGGRGTAEATALLVGRFPEHRTWIEAYYGQFDRMMKGEIAGSVAILRELKEREVPVYGLTNWAADTFPVGERRFDFLGLFDGIVVSGREGMMKPDPAIFHLACDRFAIEAEATVFIDDHAPNIEAAGALGFHALHFTSPDRLRGELVEMGLLAG
jgi:HAD superfamily hydrolase (TIGR01509 family)